MSSIREGGCLCDSVRFRIEGPFLDSGYCHCRMCQKNTGAPVVAYVSIARCGFSWIAGNPGVHHSSDTGRRHFCTSCGSYMAFTSTLYPDEISVNTATLDDATAPETSPRRHIFTESRLPWFDTTDDLPRETGCGDYPSAT